MENRKTRIRHHCFDYMIKESSNSSHYYMWSKRRSKPCKARIMISLITNSIYEIGNHICKSEKLSNQIIYLREDIFKVAKNMAINNR